MKTIILMPFVMLIFIGNLFATTYTIEDNINGSIYETGTIVNNHPLKSDPIYGYFDLKEITSLYKTDSLILHSATINFLFSDDYDPLELTVQDIYGPRYNFYTREYETKIVNRYKNPSDYSQAKVENSGILSEYSGLSISHMVYNSDYYYFDTDLNKEVHVFEYDTILDSSRDWSIRFYNMTNYINSAILHDSGILDYEVYFYLGDGYFDRAYIELDLDGELLNPVPEPSTFLLLGSGLVGLAWYGRKRKNFRK